MEAKQQAAREAAIRRGGSREQSRRGDKGFVESIFESDAVGGIKIAPKNVLVLSLMFIAAVVVLHFFDKLKL